MGEGLSSRSELLLVSLHVGGETALPSLLYEYDILEISFVRALPSWPTHSSRLIFNTITCEFEAQNFFSKALWFYYYFLVTNRLSSSYI